MKRAVLLASNGGVSSDISAVLRAHGFETIALNWSDSDQVIRPIQEKAVALLVVGAPAKYHEDAIKLLGKIRRIDTEVPVFLIAADGTEDLAVSALRLAVTDYFKEPVGRGEFADSLKRIVAKGLSQPGASLCQSTLQSRSNLVGDSPSICQIRDYISRIARTDSSVLITGETGTGKEVAAGLIHNESPRCCKPFVCINCAAIPDALVESELFGYERGAFTGADRLQEGRLTNAAGGTVFLDEVGDLSSYAQAKVLRAIETREVQRLGGRGNVHLDIRIVAATNRDLDSLARQGGFRSDLLFRLNVLQIDLPPLRDRREDIPPLIDHFIARFNHVFQRCVEGLVDGALDSLLAYDWPGNVRELKNMLETSFAELPPRSVGFIDVPEPFRKRIQRAMIPECAERQQLLAALLSTNWNKTETARQLNWSRMTLYRKMAKHSISHVKGLAVRAAS